jgi:hypothetical protein
MKKTDNAEKSVNNQLVLRDTPKGIAVKTRVTCGRSRSSAPFSEDHTRASATCCTISRSF